MRDHNHDDIGVLVSLFRAPGTRATTHLLEDAGHAEEDGGLNLLQRVDERPLQRIWACKGHREAHKCGAINVQQRSRDVGELQCVRQWQRCTGSVIGSGRGNGNENLMGDGRAGNRWSVSQRPYAEPSAG